MLCNLLYKTCLQLHPLGKKIIKLGHAYGPTPVATVSTSELEAARAEGQVHPQLCSKCECSLGYRRKA